MGKTTNYLLGTFLGISILVGWCTAYVKQKTIDKQSVKINNLEKQLNEDSISDYENYLKLSNSLKDTSIFYSDSIRKISDLYNKTILENKKLNGKMNNLSYALKKTENSNKNFIETYRNLENKYALLEKDHNELKNDDSLLKEKNNSLEKSFNKIKEDYKREQQKNAEIINKKRDEAQFNIKNQNFFKNWKSISPRFFGVSGKFISFKDNDPKEMEAFAEYGSGRLIPLKKLDDFDKCSGFYLPEINFKEGALVVYAIDKDGNKSKEQTLYISGDTVYTSQPKKIKK